MSSDRGLSALLFMTTGSPEWAERCHICSAGFCASCNGNEYWLNHGHGLVYAVTGISDARHVGEYVDSNGDIGMVVNGVRDFTFNDG